MKCDWGQYFYGTAKKKKWEVLVAATSDAPAFNRASASTGRNGPSILALILPFWANGSSPGAVFPQRSRSAAQTRCKYEA